MSPSQKYEKTKKAVKVGCLFVLTILLISSLFTIALLSL